MGGKARQVHGYSVDLEHDVIHQLIDVNLNQSRVEVEAGWSTPVGSSFGNPKAPFLDASFIYERTTSFMKGLLQSQKVLCTSPIITNLPHEI